MLVFLPNLQNILNDNIFHVRIQPFTVADVNKKFLFVWWSETVTLHSSDCLILHYRDQAGFEFRDHLPLLPSTGNKGVHHYTLPKEEINIAVRSRVLLDVNRVDQPLTILFPTHCQTDGQKFINSLWPQMQ